MDETRTTRESIKCLKQNDNENLAYLVFWDTVTRLLKQCLDEKLWL